MFRTWIEIDSQALRHNIKVLRGLLKPETSFLAVVKANAYGHGLDEVSEIAARAGVEVFGVDCLEDAIKLRRKFPAARIVVLGYILLSDLATAVAHGIEFVVYNKETIETLRPLPPSKIHLKIETGTVRQGVKPEDLEIFIELLKSAPQIELVGLATHFATAEDADGDFLKQQFEELKNVEQKIRAAGFVPKYLHCACSAAFILHPETQGTMVRAGLAMYGVWPSDYIKKNAVGFELKPALAWKTRVAQIKKISAGATIGYSRTETLTRPSRIAVLPVGYFDGYDRRLSSVGEVLIKNKRCKILGRVCMNMTMVDVTDVPEAKIEDEVVLIGSEITVDELADKTDTIAYEVLARIRPDLPRYVV